MSPPQGPTGDDRLPAKPSGRPPSANGHPYINPAHSNAYRSRHDDPPAESGAQDGGGREGPARQPGPAQAAGAPAANSAAPHGAAANSPAPNASAPSSPAADFGPGPDFGPHPGQQPAMPFGQPGPHFGPPPGHAFGQAAYGSPPSGAPGSGGPAHVPAGPAWPGSGAPGASPGLGAAAAPAPPAAPQQDAAAGAGDAHAAPADRPRRRRGLAVALVAIGAVLVVAAGFGITSLATGGFGQRADTQAGGGRDGSRGEGSGGDGPQAGQQGEATSTGPSSAAAADPKSQLDAIVTDDTRTAKTTLEGRWVVQLSSKKPDSADEAGYAAVLKKYRGEKASHPDAMLLFSSDWPSFLGKGYWVTILAKPYDSGSAAVAACRDLGLDSDHCYGKKLSSTEGPKGTYKYH
ncbi:hypothetical protein BRM1_09140 [Brevibacterium sp. BRM-1]|uniref:hypothetical protein n=1 Tax=Brevibacterium sp. BRM-1 TaxID=2999062 RepID=UPI0022818010|nr:hypothetical protein [Brevibacterium sp. BRM-1]WAL39443.1 hypothetical protein BRM1_09140 [Brevibacterium sp. BRM-1]